MATSIADGDDLVLRAPAPPPSDVINLLSRHKSEVVALLRPKKHGLSAEDWLALFEERAGCFEFDNGLSRTDADRCAFEACMIKIVEQDDIPASHEHPNGQPNASSWSDAH